MSQRTADRSYWEQRIAALTIGQLPAGQSPADQTPRSLLGGMHELSLSQTVALGLQKLAREAGAPLQVCCSQPICAFSRACATRPRSRQVSS